MPIAQSNGCPIHYEVEGDASKPVLMFCNSLGTNLHMWDGQMPEVLKHFRVVRYDRPGHGKSGSPQAPTTWKCSGETHLRCSMPPRSRRRTGAGCRWAAWSACGSAPT